MDLELLEWREESAEPVATMAIAVPSCQLYYRNLPWPHAVAPFCTHSCQNENSTVPQIAAAVQALLADIPPMTSKIVEIVPLSHRQGNCIPFAATRWHDFGNRPALGSPFGHISRPPDTPLMSLSPRRRFPRPTPERVFVADHQSAVELSRTSLSEPPLRPVER